VVLLVSVSRENISVLAGVIQAIGHLAQKLGAGWMGPPFALLLSLAIAGSASAWIAGCARIPFVAGLDSRLPGWLGKVHPRYHTPHAALGVQFVISGALVLIGFVSSGVQEAFQRLLSLAVVLELIPFLYIFAALLKTARGCLAVEGHYSRRVVTLAGTSGLLTTALGVVFAFSPSQQITSVFSYETWMLGGTVFFLGLAFFFFYGYGRQRAVQVHAPSDL